MNNLPSFLPHQVNITTLTEHIEECHFQLFGFYPTDTQEANYQILRCYFEDYSEVFARKVLEKAADEVVVDFYIPDDASIPDYVKDEIEVYALKHSITDIELPKHE